MTVPHVRNRGEGQSRIREHLEPADGVAAARQLQRVDHLLHRLGCDRHAMDAARDPPNAAQKAKPLCGDVHGNTRKYGNESAAAKTVSPRAAASMAFATPRRTAGPTGPEVHVPMVAQQAA